MFQAIPTIQIMTAINESSINRVGVRVYLVDLHNSIRHMALFNKRIMNCLESTE